MQRIDFKKTIQTNWIHVAAIAFFLLTTFFYFRPQFSGYMLEQHDIAQFQGMVQEVKAYRDKFGEEPLWTNSMFGGMPTYQISTYYDGNIISKINYYVKLGMNSPAGIFFLYLLCFYIASLLFRFKPIIGVLGSLVFAFSSYNIIILQAGHNSKAAAIALAVPVIGSFYFAFRRKPVLGILLSALFMSMEMAANHLQITYYLGILLIFMGGIELYRLIKEKSIGLFLKVTGGMILAYLVAILINYGNISMTNDYAKHTIRGGNDITINPDGTSKADIATEGLDKDYILQWSNGIAESFTMLSPYVKGGGTTAVQNSPFAGDLKSKEFRRNAPLIAKNNAYWGDQLFVSGPVYLGIIVVFLAFLALVFTKDLMVWGMFGASILCLMLAWGSNFPVLTDFFLDYIPGYNKFRAVTIILSILGITIPLLALFFLDQLITEKNFFVINFKKLIIATSSFFGVLIILIFTGIGDGFLSEQESEFISNYENEVKQQIISSNPQIDKEDLSTEVNLRVQNADQQFDALIDFRKHIYQSSLWRSIGFGFVGFGLILIFIKFNLKHEYIVFGLIIMALIDLVLVDLNYLNNERKGSTYKHWMKESDYSYPYNPTKADLFILEQEVKDNNELAKTINDIEASKFNKNGKKILSQERNLMKFNALNFATNYRVFEPNGLTSSTRSSYFHKSIGGYHGAKLRRIQNVFDFHFGKGNMEVLNMLNIKYFIQGEQVQTNANALGNAWLVKELKIENSPNDEIRSLGPQFAIKLLDNNYQLTFNNNRIDSIEVTTNEWKSIEINDIPIIFENIERSKIDAYYVEDVYGKMEWLPKIEFEKDTSDSFKKILEVNLMSDFDSKNEAIISNEDALNLSNLVFSGEGKIDLKSYLPNELNYDVQISEESQFAVFSEIYYPDGWKAFIKRDKEEKGKEVPIHRVNYLLRGIELPTGNYELQMRFEVDKFKTVNWISLISSSLLIFALLGYVISQLLKLRNSSVEEHG